MISLRVRLELEYRVFTIGRKWPVLATGSVCERLCRNDGR
jgi:hypothetical protein